MYSYIHAYLYTGIYKVADTRYIGINLVCKLENLSYFRVAQTLSNFQLGLTQFIKHLL